MRARDLSRIDGTMLADKRRSKQRSRWSRWSRPARPVRCQPRPGHTTGDVPNHGAHDANHGGHGTSHGGHGTGHCGHGAGSAGRRGDACEGTAAGTAPQVPCKRSGHAGRLGAWWGGARRCRQQLRRQPPGGLLSPSHTRPSRSKNPDPGETTVPSWLQTGQRAP